MIQPVIVICNKVENCNMWGGCGHREPHSERDGCHVVIGDLQCKGAECVPIKKQPEKLTKDREPYHRRKIEAHIAKEDE